MTADKDGLVSVEELASILRAHEGPPQPSPQRPRRTSRRRPRLRWVAVAALLLLAGSGVGFGLGNWTTPRGSAGRSLDGVGLLPSRGWTVVQTPAARSAGASVVVAANVPIDHPAESSGAIPRHTLERLPARGILITAKFSPRGDPGTDVAFPVQRLPLRLSDALTVPPAGNARVAEYRLRAGVEGYNIDAAIFFGRLQPSDAQLASAQRQLSRLLVGASGVTLFARPNRSPGGLPGYELYGTVESGKAGEPVTIQTKDCGQNDFRATVGTTTVAGGGWSWQYYPGINTVVRAVWNRKASPQVRLVQRADVYLRKHRSGRQYEVRVWVKKSFWKKHIEIQRFDRKQRAWKTIERLVVGTGNGVDFVPRVPKGTLIRALLPLSQARPCYLAGVSKAVRT